MSKRHQIIEGEWTPVKKDGYSDQCCDCGLTHIIEHRERGGNFWVRKRVDKRATAAARRAFKFEKDDG